MFVEPSYNEIFQEIRGIYESLLQETEPQSEYEKRRNYINSIYSDYDLAKAHASEALKDVIKSKVRKLNKKGPLLSIHFSTGDFVICKSWSTLDSDLKSFEGLVVSNISREKSNLVIEFQGGQTLTCQRHSENIAVKNYPALFSSKHDAFFHLAWNGVHASAEY